MSNPIIKTLQPHGTILTNQNVNLVITLQCKECSTIKSVPALYRWRRELFAVYTPFYMDSQAARLQRYQGITCSEENPTAHEHSVAQKETSADKKRKRKRKLCLKDDEFKLSDKMRTALSSLVAEAKECKVLVEPSEDIFKNSHNNKEARQAAAVASCGNLFQDLCNDFDLNGGRFGHEWNLHLEKCPHMTFSASSVVNKFVRNDADSGLCLTLDYHKFLIPPHSRFLTSDMSMFVSHLYKCLKDEAGYDVIVIDPPWTNKSVKRKKGYKSILEKELCSLPIQELSKPGSLVIVWVTNNSKIDAFVKEKLFGCWNIDLVAEWIWMKVTITGQPVLEVDSHHKKPYERLLIGKVLPSADSQTTESSTVTEEIESVIRKTSTFESHSSTPELDSEAQVSQSGDCHPLSVLPTDFMILSVPCALHSKKPPLQGILEPYLPLKPKCLELFARNLWPGWTSWGNEPLKHQHMDYFEECSSEGIS